MELILASYIADFVFGDPRWLPHPVRLIGKLIAFLERTLNSRRDKVIQRFYGVFTALGVIGISGICAYVIIEVAEKLHPIVGNIAWIFLAYTTLATKDLILHSRSVHKLLLINDIEGARKSLSLIVGRNTEKLSQDDVIRATVETIAESTNDGIVSPLFYLFLGGPVLAIMFKAVSTLDSMIGYKNEKYLHFGWCAAKLDTVVNFIPARITGLLVAVAALFCGKNPVLPLRIMFRDGRKQDSFNSAISEAAMAGALGIQLGGICSYAGRIVEHPYIGEQKKPMTSALINEALLITIITSALMVSIGIITQQVILHIFHL